MDIEDIILADYAVADPRGKFTIIGGGLTTIHAAQFPCTHPVMYVLIRLKVEGNDEGRNRIELTLEGEGKPVVKTEGNLDLKKDPSIRERSLALPIRLLNLIFEKPGDYVLRITVNGQQSLKEQTLAVREIAGEKPSEGQSA